MNTILVRGLLTTALTLGLVGALHAKGATVKLTITGTTLTQPLELTDPVLLASSNVFEGSFLGTQRIQPDPSLPRYRVSFHVQPPRWMKRDVEVKYVVLYAKNAQTGEGFIYLPARDEDGYRLNIGTILRDGRDGTWQAASPTWANALNKHLP